MSTAKEKKERGRPTKFTKDIGEKICQRLRDGETLRHIAKDETMPPESTVRSWAADDVDGFFAQYARAREIGYETLADELLEISDDNAFDVSLDKDGGWKVNGEIVQRSRLKTDTRKWLLSKALPKVYGDRVTHAGDAENPIAIKDQSAGDIARRIAFLLGNAARPGSGGAGDSGDEESSVDTKSGSAD